MMTVAPSSTNRRAIAAPSPRAAPVISAVLPLSLFMVFPQTPWSLRYCVQRANDALIAALRASTIGLQFGMAEDVEIVCLNRGEHHIADHRRVERVRHDGCMRAALIGVGPVAGQQMRSGVGIGLQILGAVAARS